MPSAARRGDHRPTPEGFGSRRLRRIHDGKQLLRLLRRHAMPGEAAECNPPSARAMTRDVTRDFEVRADRSTSFCLREGVARWRPEVVERRPRRRTGAHYHKTRWAACSFFSPELRVPVPDCRVRVRANGTADAAAAWQAAGGRTLGARDTVQAVERGAIDAASGCGSACGRSPTTQGPETPSRGQGQRPTLSAILRIGAGGRTRTDDLLITNQLLYRLSYAGCRNLGRVPRPEADPPF